MSEDEHHAAVPLPAAAAAAATADVNEPHVLPVLALNEVYIGETLSSRCVHVSVGCVGGCVGGCGAVVDIHDLPCSVAFLAVLCYSSLVAWWHKLRYTGFYTVMTLCSNCSGQDVMYRTKDQLYTIVAQIHHSHVPVII